jgi:2-oxoacid:acceptor oxidoreductase delta subunit (pyruvate/2-ketoisovalerate family)
MSKQLIFNRESEMPYIAISRGDMAWNKTGTWRAQRPFYEDKTAPCNAACPAGNDIVSFILKMKQEDVEGAWKIIMEENPFPGVCGRVCFHPCESKCNRGGFDESISIHALERVIADFGARQSNQQKHNLRKEGGSTKGRIAIIGSGPAGMSCAFHLAKLHYAVTVFEAFPLAGGMLRRGIPAYRLPKEVLDWEISQIEALGVAIRTGVPMGQRLKIEDLKEYQAVFIATGAHQSMALNIPGETGKKISTGLDFLKKINLNEKAFPGKRVAVIGGGNTAIDVARSAIRIGKKPVILYRRSKEEMPAFEEEVLEAIEEGVEIQYLVAPIRMQQEGRKEWLECLRMELGERDESGRRSPVPVSNSNFFIEADHVILASGEEIEISLFPRGIEKREGMVLTRIGGETGVEGLFAGGDLTSRQRTVAHAIGSGKKTALAIDCYLRGEESEKVIQPLLVGGGPSVSVFPYVHPGEGIRNAHIVTLEELNMDYFEPSTRLKDSKSLIKDRIKGFGEVTSTLTGSAALKEAERCFNCGTCDECENCYLFCPDASIIKKGEEMAHQVDYDYCKGCGICFLECPRGVISLKEEAR